MTIAVGIATALVCWLRLVVVSPDPYDRHEGIVLSAHALVAVCIGFVVAAFYGVLA